MQNDRKMTIHFKNGHTIEVNKKVAASIARRAEKDGLWGFTNAEGEISLVVNISEILYIEESPLHNLTRTLADKPE